MVNTEIRLIIFFAAKDGETLYSQQKQDQELREKFLRFGVEQWHPTPVLLPGKSHGWRSLVGYSPWGFKELDTTKQLSTHTYKIIVFSIKKDKIKKGSHSGIFKK